MKKLKECNPRLMKMLLLGSLAFLAAVGFVLRLFVMREHFGSFAVNFLAPLALGCWLYYRQWRSEILEKLMRKIGSVQLLALGLPGVLAAMAVILDNFGCNLELYLPVAAAVSCCAFLQCHSQRGPDRAYMGNLVIFIGYIFLAAWLGYGFFTMLLITFMAFMTSVILMLNDVAMEGEPGWGLRCAFAAVVFAAAVAACAKIPYLQEHSYEGMMDYFEFSDRMDGINASKIIRIGAQLFGGGSSGAYVELCEDGAALLFVLYRFGWVAAGAVILAAAAAVFAALELYCDSRWQLRFVSAAAYGLLGMLLVTDVLCFFGIPYLMPAGTLMFMGDFGTNLTLVICAVILLQPRRAWSMSDLDYWDADFFRREQEALDRLPKNEAGCEELVDYLTGELGGSIHAWHVLFEEFLELMDEEQLERAMERAEEFFGPEELMNGFPQLRRYEEQINE